MITVKEEFLSEEKTKRAIRLGGHETVTMWLALKGYCCRKLTDGFVPDSAIDDLQGAPKAPRRALKALVECGFPGRNGTVGSGLVEQVKGGWQLHDYLDHARSAVEEEDRRSHARERKKAWRQRNRQPDVPTVPTCVPGTEAGTVSRDVPGTETGTERVCPSRARARSPAQPSPALRSEDPDICPIGTDQSESSQVGSGIVSATEGSALADQEPLGALGPSAAYECGNPGTGDPWGLTPPDDDPVREVFDHWAKSLWPKVHPDGRSPKASEKRLAKIRARLADNYTVEQLKSVIDRIGESPYHLGQNDSRTPYIEFETIFRSAEKVDGWLAKASAATRSCNRSTFNAPNAAGDWKPNVV